MARPKPPMPLINRHTRMNEVQFQKFRELGGPEWLRDLLDKEIQKSSYSKPQQHFLSVWRHLN